MLNSLKSQTLLLSAQDVVRIVRRKGLPTCIAAVAPGPTVESNLCRVQGCEAVLCLVDDHAGADHARLLQLVAVLAVGSPAAWLATAARLAARPGPIIGLLALPPGATQTPLERLVVERSVSTNTAAAGGNANLMTVV